MNELNLLLESTSGDQLAVTSLLVNLLIGLFLALIIRYHFRRFGSTLSNREEFAQVFPFVLLTTILIITIVKFSIALSLGLVGALSIVRFRTPIKEPEELAYLFISIAAGLGLGANQVMATVLSVITILLSMAVLKNKWKADHSKTNNLFVSLSFDKDKMENKDNVFNKVNAVASSICTNVNLRRYDIDASSINLMYLMTFKDSESIDSLTKKIVELYPNASINYLDQSNLPSI
jgi:uncharacterized membrane protein YhiD involved in acid resistance